MWDPFDDEPGRAIGNLRQTAAADAPLPRRRPTATATDDPDPLLVLGDVGAYDRSPRRVVTVTTCPRPDGAPEISDWHHDRFDRILAGLDASYDPQSRASTAVHTHFLTPVVTPEGIEALDLRTRTALTHDGVPLWHRVIEGLRPDVVLLPIGAELLTGLEWVAAPRVARLQGQGSRTLRARWYRTSDGHDLVVVDGGSRNGPYGTLTGDEQRSAGVAIAELLRHGPDR